MKASKELVTKFSQLLSKPKPADHVSRKEVPQAGEDGSWIVELGDENATGWDAVAQKGAPYVGKDDKLSKVSMIGGPYCVVVLFPGVRWLYKIGDRVELKFPFTDPPCKTWGVVFAPVTSYGSAYYVQIMEGSPSPPRPEVDKVTFRMLPDFPGKYLLLSCTTDNRLKARVGRRLRHPPVVHDGYIGRSNTHLSHGEFAFGANGLSYGFTLGAEGAYYPFGEVPPGAHLVFRSFPLVDYMDGFKVNHKDLLEQAGYELVAIDTTSVEVGLKFRGTHCYWRILPRNRSNDGTSTTSTYTRVSTPPPPVEA